MLTQILTHAAAAHPGWYRPGAWHAGPGWWLAFPIVFWLLVLSAVAYVIYWRSPRHSARRSAEHTLAELFARGEISEDELKQRRAVLRGRS